ncbi:hypothetical protein BDV32DRAFT_85289 [Aspergillus pseudonomiae]|nr:hypothetical protein BDV32DRAFT_85289 [Aspergillus pseudonomiae]
MLFRFLAFLTLRAQRCIRLALAPIYHSQLQRAAFTISVIWQSRLVFADHLLRLFACEQAKLKGYEDLIWLLFLFALIFCFYEDNIWMSCYPYVGRPGARTYVMLGVVRDMRKSLSRKGSPAILRNTCLDNKE